MQKVSPSLGNVSKTTTKRKTMQIATAHSMGTRRFSKRIRNPLENTIIGNKALKKHMFFKTSKSLKMYYVLYHFLKNVGTGWAAS